MYGLLSLTLCLAAWCTVTLILTAIANLIYNVYLHPLRSYPGPKLWAASRLAWTYSLLRGSLHRQVKELHDQYGPVVRIAPNELSYIDAQAWKDIYNTRLGQRVMEKNRVWAKPRPGDPSSIVGVNEGAHARHRKGIMGAFTEHAVREHALLIESYVGLMVEKFKQSITAGQGHTVVDMVDWMNFLAFDISGALSFGDSFHSVEDGRAHPWVDISCNFGKGLAFVTSVSFFAPLDELLRYTLPTSIMQKMEYHKQLVKEKVHQRLDMQDKIDSQDYVATFTRYNQEKGGRYLLPDELELNMAVLIFAGSETTSSAMGAILTHLLRAPVALRKLQDEIRSAFHREDEIVISSVGKFEFLTAVIQEGLRLSPPAAIGFPRVVPQGGAMISGHWVPAGTFMAVNQYPTYRSPANFHRPDDFIPERFTEGVDGDNMAVFEPFLVGRHSCVGQKLAWAEMRITLARLLYSFDISSAQGPVREWGEQKTLIFWQKVPLMISLQPRPGH